MTRDKEPQPLDMDRESEFIVYKAIKLLRPVPPQEGFDYEPDE